MTELLLQLMNAPRRAQRIVAILLLIVAVTLGLTVVYGALMFVAGQGEDIVEQRRDLAQINALVAKKPVTGITPAASHDQSIFLEGGEIGVLQAKLQEIVSAIATASGSTISSATGVAETEFDGVAFVGLRVNLEGGMKSTLDTVVAIETAMPPLIVQKADMRANNVAAGEDLTQPLQISTQLTIYAAIQPAASKSAAGAQP
ncbi:type II secretion system protein GspM [Ensifer sp. ENS12]|uniref:type II secretion system protein GspM n=1 Tax=Ensifer sp. ENS12 TaxID=2854774 RepID=UPI001C43CCCA|nr:type II secretion system protein GspM [Ensifer sp. ENS12]MBV7518872.1 type II secretion system protein M [Ensifer sp. ENS12]